MNLLKQWFYRMQLKTIVLAIALFAVLIPAVWMYFQTGEDFSPVMSNIISLLIVSIAGLEGLDKTPKIMEKYQNIKNKNESISEQPKKVKENGDDT